MLVESWPANALTWLPMSIIDLIWSDEVPSIFFYFDFLFVYKSSASGSSPMTSF
jgi:hypothetical protein